MDPSDRKTAAFGGGLTNAAVYFYSTRMGRVTGRWQKYRSEIDSRSGKVKASLFRNHLIRAPDACQHYIADIDFV
jgi:hypothetical protein